MDNVVRPLLVKDFDRLVSIFTSVIKENREAFKGEKEAVGIDMLSMIVTNQELKCWLAELVGVFNIQEFDEMPATTLLDIVESAGFADFFGRAWRLVKPMFGTS